MNTASQGWLINLDVSYGIHQQVSKRVGCITPITCQTTYTHVDKRLIAGKELRATFAGNPHHFAHLNEHATGEFKRLEIINGAGIQIMLVEWIHVLVHTANTHPGLVFFNREQGFYGPN